MCRWCCFAFHLTLHGRPGGERECAGGAVLPFTSDWFGRPGGERECACGGVLPFTSDWFARFGGGVPLSSNITPCLP